MRFDPLCVLVAHSLPRHPSQSIEISLWFFVRSRLLVEGFDFNARERFNLQVPVPTMTEEVSSFGRAS